MEPSGAAEEELERGELDGNAQQKKKARKGKFEEASSCADRVLMRAARLLVRLRCAHAVRYVAECFLVTFAGERQLWSVSEFHLLRREVMADAFCEWVGNVYSEDVV